MPPPEPSLLTLLDELREYASYYLEVQADRARLTLRKLVLGVVVAAAGVTVLLSLVATTTTLLLTGIAGGLAEAFGGRAWLGNLATGGGVLLLGALGLWTVRGIVGRLGFKHMAAKYAKRRTEQRDRFGRDVSQTTESSTQRS